MKPSEKFRHHHRELIDAFKDRVHRLREGDEATLDEFEKFLEEELLSHARAEEEELYSVIDDRAGTHLATASMRADHEELEGRIRNFNFSEITDRFLTELTEFEALLLNHFEKEEEVLLPFLADHLEDEVFNEILGDVHASEEKHRDGT